MATQKQPVSRPLPLPPSGRVRALVHLGDVHIPFVRNPHAPGQKERLHHHAVVIDALVRSVARLRSVRHGEAAVLIAGDVLDCRHTANASTVALLIRLVEGLCRAAPVYITTGNHDLLLEEEEEEEAKEEGKEKEEELGGGGRRGRQCPSTEGTDAAAAATATAGRPVSSPDPDLLGALLRPMISAGMPLAYLNRTGVYGTRGSGLLLGVLHIRDAMVPGNCSGDMKPLHAMPFDGLRLLRDDPTTASRVVADKGDGRSIRCPGQDGDAAVFVFHGQVCDGSFPGGGGGGPFRRRRPPILELASRCGYDACLLGDVHTMQIHDMSPLLRHSHRHSAVGDKDGGATDDEDDDDARSPPLSSAVRACKDRDFVAWRDASDDDSAPLPWAYCGSTTQLSANECLFPHGFITWSWKSSAAAGDAGSSPPPLPGLHVVARPYHIPAPFGIVVAEADSRRDGGGEREPTIRNGVQPLTGEAAPPQALSDLVRGSTLTPDMFPPEVSLRVTGSNGNGNGGRVTIATVERAADTLASACSTRVVNCGRSSVTTVSEARAIAMRRQRQNADSESPSAEIVDDDSDVDTVVDLSSFGRPRAWVEYLEEQEKEAERIDGDGGHGDEDTNSGSGSSRSGREARLRAWAAYLTHPEASVGLPPPPALSAAVEALCGSGAEQTKADAPSPAGIPSSSRTADRAPDPQPLPMSVMQKLQERNARLAKKAAEAAACVKQHERDSGGGAGTGRRVFALRMLRWSWMLCFGPDNEFDFSSITGKVALLAGPNGKGKSSVLEILCLALYGQAMPSRGGKASAVDVPCRACPPNAPATTSIDIAVPGGGEAGGAGGVDHHVGGGGETRFRITRTFGVSPTTRRATSTARVARLVAPGDTPVTIKDGSSAVSSWVAEHLGTLQGFLLCSLLSQHGDADFFGMKAADQRALLDDALALDAVRVTCDALKEARLAHGAAVDAVSTAMETALDAFRGRGGGRGGSGGGSSTGGGAADVRAWIARRVDDSVASFREAVRRRDECAAAADIARETARRLRGETLPSLDAELEAVPQASVIDAGDDDGVGAGACEEAEKEAEEGGARRSLSELYKEATELGERARDLVERGARWPADWLDAAEDGTFEDVVSGGAAREARVLDEALGAARSDADALRSRLATARQELDTAASEHSALRQPREKGQQDGEEREREQEEGEPMTTVSEDELRARYAQAMADLERARACRERADAAASDLRSCAARTAPLLLHDQGIVKDDLDEAVATVCARFGCTAAPDVSANDDSPPPFEAPPPRSRSYVEAFLRWRERRSAALAELLDANDDGCCVALREAAAACAAATPAAGASPFPSAAPSLIDVDARLWQAVSHLVRVAEEADAMERHADAVGRGVSTLRAKRREAAAAATTMTTTGGDDANAAPPPDEREQDDGDDDPHNPECWACSSRMQKRRERKERKERKGEGGEGKGGEGDTTEALMERECEETRQRAQRLLREETGYDNDDSSPTTTMTPTTVASAKKAAAFCERLKEWTRTWTSFGLGYLPPPPPGSGSAHRPPATAATAAAEESMSALLDGWAADAFSDARLALWLTSRDASRAEAEHARAHSASADSKAAYKRAKELREDPIVKERIERAAERARRAAAAAQEREEARERSWRRVDEALGRVRDQEGRLEASARHVQDLEVAARVAEDRLRRAAEFASEAREELGGLPGKRATEAARRRARVARSACALRAREMAERRRRCREDVVHAERNVERAIADMHREEARARAAAEERARGEEFRATYGAWVAYRDVLDERRCSFVGLLRAMEGFAAWVYAQRALPSIQDEVNALLAPLAGGEGGLVLRGSCGGLDGDRGGGGGDAAAATEQQQQQQSVSSSSSTPTGGNLEWTLNGTPLTKCSGMQRFAAALAMRLALSRLGACNVACTHLLIDEGFGALDSRHITTVPDFLHTCILASGRFASVLLVSHLEGVREAADVVIPIRHRRSAAAAVGAQTQTPASSSSSSSLLISELRYHPAAE